MASMRWFAITFSGREQMHRKLQSGKRRRRRETIERSVASFPKFVLPKLPKKVMLAGPLAAGCVGSEGDAPLIVDVYGADKLRLS
jgi:hypothetical protein